MNHIDTCLDALSNIDTQTLYAEGDVITNHIAWSDKVSVIIEMLTENNMDIDSYFQEASAGTGITVSKGDNLIKRLYDFIRKVIRSIINKVSDLLTKFKIRNYEYVELPMSETDIQKDLDTIDEIMSNLIKIGFDSVDFNDAKADTIKSELGSLIKTTKGLNINKDRSNNKERYGVKPDEFMKFRDKIRAVDKRCRELQKRTDAHIKRMEHDSSVKPEWLNVVKIQQKLFVELSKSTTKMFTGFKFSSAKKVTKDELLKALQKTRDGLESLLKDDKKIIQNSYIDYIDDDAEYFDETEKPFDAYLKNHKYDSKTNTIEFEGKRKNAGEIPSAKERNRINKFLRENKYDPKTETIQTDIKNKDGSYKRIKFDIHSQYDNGFGPAYYDNDKDSIFVSKDTLGKKPRESNQTFKHEEGHANQKIKKNEDGIKVGMEPRPEYSKKINDFMKDNPVDYEHYKDYELDADLYGYQHNPYASSEKGDKGQFTRAVDNELKKAPKQVESYKKWKDKSRQDDIERTCKFMEERLLDRLKLAKDYMQRWETMTELYPNNSPRISGILRRSIDRIEDIEHELNVLRKTKFHPEIAERIKKINDIFEDDIKEAIIMIDKVEEALKNEIGNRDKFLDENKHEAGSQARKLEGRQGKHKGKK